MDTELNYWSLFILVVVAYVVVVVSIILLIENGLSKPKRKERAMRRHIAYLWYVLRHKWFVLAAGIWTVPLWMLIIHDWDKFLSDEWFPYAKMFYNPDGSKKQYERPEPIDFAFAWKRHQCRNKHHWQYWCLIDDVPLYDTMAMIWDRGEAQGFNIGSDDNIHFDKWVLSTIPDERVHCLPMPELYVWEMIADWQGAGRAINGKGSSTLAWYTGQRLKMKLHPETRALVDNILGYYEIEDSHE